MGYYDQALVCKNGHTINDSSRKRPEHNQKFCAICGEQSISVCSHCNTPIRGDYHVDGVIMPSTFVPPSFCYECGNPFPWVELKLRAAEELAMELDEITDEDRQKLVNSLKDIVSDSPMTTVAATRFNKVMTKLRSPIVSAFRDILVDVVSETAKKAIWGQ